MWSNDGRGHVKSPSHYRPPCCQVDIRRYLGDRRVRDDERLFGYTDATLSKGHAHLSLRIEHVLVVARASGCGLQWVLPFRYAFSLEETDSRDAAEEMCKESLRLQRKNPWGIHTLSN